MENGVQRLQEFARTAEIIARDHQLELHRKLIAAQNPGSVSQGFEPKVNELKRAMDRFCQDAPHARQYCTALEKDLRTRIDFQQERANDAYESRRALEQEGLRGKYNDALTDALAGAPSQTRDALRGQVRSAMKKLVDAAFEGQQYQQVPGNVKQTMTNELSRWLLEQDAIEDAFFVAQSVVTDVAVYLQRKLTFTAEITRTKQTLTSASAITPEQAESAANYAGALGQQSAELDRTIAADARRNIQTRVRGYFSFNPGLVLDPAKHFVKDLELKAGIKITSQEIRIDLGAKVKVVDPFSDERTANLNPYARLQISDDFTLNATYNNNLGLNQARSQSLNIGAQWQINDNANFGASYQNDFKGNERFMATIRISF